MKLATTAPFHLEGTVRLLQRLPTNAVDRWDGRCWTRALPVAGALCLVSVENLGTALAPELRLAVAGGAASRAELRALARTVGRVLGLERDPRPFARVARHLAGATELLRPLAGLRPPCYPTLVEAIANAVAFQQVSIESGTAVVARLAARHGLSLETAGERRHAFPEARALARARLDGLRATGLSKARALALRGAARRIEDGSLDTGELERLTTAEAIVRLEEIPGLGPWSSRLILLRGLGRLDAFPLGDVGVLRGLAPRLSVAAGLVPAHEVLAETLGDERGYLYFAALALKQIERGLIAGPG